MRRGLIHTRASWSSSEPRTTVRIRQNGEQMSGAAAAPRCAPPPSARHGTAICPHHIDAIKSGLINPLVPLTFIQHARFFPHRGSLERPRAPGNARQQNSGYVNAKKLINVTGYKGSVAPRGDL